MKVLIKVFGCLLIVAFLTSCGGGGDSGGAERLRTVQVLPPIVSATAPNDDQLEDTLPFTPTSILKSDVAKWLDIDGDDYISDDRCDFMNGKYAVESDKVYVKFVVIGLPNLPSNIIPSAVRIDEVKITFTPSTSNIKPIPTQYRSLGAYVYPAFNKDKNMYYGYTFVSFDLISENIKNAFPELICADKFYYYYVTLEFDVIEVNSGKKETVQTALTVSIGDHFDRGKNEMEKEEGE